LADWLDGRRLAVMGFDENLGDAPRDHLRAIDDSNEHPSAPTGPGST
jgi:hypothetical protein